MLELIVAVDKNWGFAKDGGIPWHFPADMKFFSEKTKTVSDNEKENIVLMGRKTWESIPEKFRPLRNRINIVVSRNLELQTNDNLYVVRSIEDGVKLSLDLVLGKKAEKVFVIGGLALYDFAMNNVLLSKVHITKINKNYDCDRFFNKQLLFEKCTHSMENDIEVNENETDMTFMEFIHNGNYEGEYQYLKIMWDCIKDDTNFRSTRNSNTWSKFGTTMKFDLRKGFPIVTTRKSFLRSAFYELKMFLLGETNTKKWLADNGINIWKWNTTREFLDSMNLNYEEHDMGNLYGFQWRHFGSEYDGMDKDYTGKGFDQVEYVKDLIINDPSSRRILIATYDPSRAHLAPLFPCHSLILQFYITNKNELNVMMYQRSADTFLGENMNIISTSLLCTLFAKVINNDERYKGPTLVPGVVTITLGDYHVYENQLDVVKTQLSRNPLPIAKLNINRETDKFEEFEWEDIELVDYQFYPPLRAPMVA